MSNRTIVEFNHDFASRIHDSPEDFADVIMTMLNQGVNDNVTKLTDELEFYGITVTPTHHHSEDARVVIGDYCDVAF